MFRWKKYYRYILPIPFILLLFITTFYVGYTYFLVPTFEGYVREKLPDDLKTRDISFQLMPMSIELTKPHLEGAKKRPLEAESIRVNPNLGSILGDTFVIDSLEFEGISLTLYRNQPQKSEAEIPSQLTTLFEGEGELPNFRINRIKITHSTIQLLENENSKVPELDLSPIELSLGPVTPSNLKSGLNLSAVSGLSGIGEYFFLQATLKMGEPILFEGDLRLQDINPGLIKPALTPGLRVSGGRLNGSLSFRYDGNRLRIPSIKMKLAESQVKITSGSSPLPETKLEPAIQETLHGTPHEEPEIPFQLAIDDIQLELSDSRLYLSELLVDPSIPPIEISDALVKGGPYGPDNPILPLLGQFITSTPAGVVEFKSELDLTTNTFQLDHILSDINVDDVSDLNPYTQNYLPVRLSEGSLTGAMNGKASSKSLNLAFELDFNGLKMRSGKKENGRFLEVPVNVYLNYLSKKGGQLDIAFKITGTPQSPNVEVSKIRNRILMNLGVDAAVLSSIGLPVFIGSKVVEHVTGFSLINEAKSTFSGFFETPKKTGDAPKLKKSVPEQTPIPTRTE